MKKNHLIFLAIFIIFLSFGLILFYKSLKEIKEVEKEIAFKPPEVEGKKEVKPQEGSDFKFKNLEGKTFNLSDFKGKYVFMTFWATWRRFCAMELPEIQKLYENYKNIEFIMLSPEEPEKVKSYINLYKYKFPVYIQISSTPSNFRTSGIPANFILDKEGKIILKKEGYFNWLSAEAKSFLDSLK